jgi:hypothetical protein
MFEFDLQLFTTNPIVLMHYDSNFIDTSGKTWTASNVFTTTSDKPIKLGSGSFNGNGTGYLRIPTGIAGFNFGSNDFTVDFWISMANFSGSPVLAEQINGGTGYGWKIFLNSGNIYWHDLGTGNYTKPHGMSAGVYYHIAFVRHSGILTCYINGVSLGGVSHTPTTSGNIATIMATVTGGYNVPPANSFMDEFRVSNIARWSSNFTPPVSNYSVDGNTLSLLHFDGDFTDQIGTVWTPYNNPTAYANNYKFGNASFFMNGNTSFITTSTNADFAFGANDFTIDFWLYPTVVSTGGTIFSTSSSATYPGIKIAVSGGITQYYLSSTGGSFNLVNSKTMGTEVLNTWTHYALVRSGTTVYAFQNGIIQSTTTGVSGSILTDATPGIGVNASIGTWTNAYMDEFRAQNGIASWTSNFIPPTAPYGIIPISINSGVYRKVINSKVIYSDGIRKLTNLLTVIQSVADRKVSISITRRCNSKRPIESNISFFSGTSREVKTLVSVLISPRTNRQIVNDVNIHSDTIRIVSKSLSYLFANTMRKLSNTENIKSQTSRTLIINSLTVTYGGIYRLILKQEINQCNLRRCIKIGKIVKSPTLRKVTNTENILNTLLRKVLAQPFNNELNIPIRIAHVMNIKMRSIRKSNRYRGE